MEIGNTRDIDAAIRNARPLSLLARQRRGIRGRRAGSGKRNSRRSSARGRALRRQTIARAKSRTVLGGLAAAAGR